MNHHSKTALRGWLDILESAGLRDRRYRLLCETKENGDKFISFIWNSSHQDGAKAAFEEIINQYKTKITKVHSLADVRVSSRGGGGGGGESDLSAIARSCKND